MIYLKSSEEIFIMREAGKILAKVHAAMRDAVKPGVSTGHINQIAETVIHKHGVIPTFLGYAPRNQTPYPAAITACVNSELVHGFPSYKVFLQEGDIVSLDVAITYKGYVADAGFTVDVGKISPEAQRLIDTGEAALKLGIEMSIIGNETRDVALAIQAFVEKQGYSVIRDYTGHGVGKHMHEEPQIPNWWPRGRKQRAWRSVPLKAGMTYALEPMIAMGSHETKTLDDGWTVVMADGKLCTWTEHTIAVTDGEPLILTLP